jgi:hypothetical protein
MPKLQSEIIVDNYLCQREKLLIRRQMMQKAWRERVVDVLAASEWGDKLREICSHAPVDLTASEVGELARRFSCYDLRKTESLSLSNPWQYARMRRRSVLRMHDGGDSISFIAKAFGFSKARAGQIVERENLERRRIESAIQQRIFGRVHTDRGLKRCKRPACKNLFMSDRVNKVFCSTACQQCYWDWYRTKTQEGRAQQRFKAAEWRAKRRQKAVNA